MRTLTLMAAMALLLTACKGEPADHIEEREPLRYAFSATAAPFSEPVNQQLSIAWLPDCVARHAPLFATAAPACRSA